jgi:hypothetical protein
MSLITFEVTKIQKTAIRAMPQLQIFATKNNLHFNEKSLPLPQNFERYEHLDYLFANGCGTAADGRRDDPFVPSD